MGKMFIKVGPNFEPLDEANYTTEDPFQEFLFQNPHVMGITDDQGNMIRIIPVAREVIVSDEAGSAFSIDLVCLDDSGMVNIIEVKRCSDTRLRREVIGQIFDYASQLCYAGEINDLKTAYEATSKGNSSRQSTSFLNEEVDQNEYWEKVKTNLQAGKIRIVIAADGIPDNLKRIIEFLNNQMDPAELIGIDLHKFAKGDLEVFTSSIIGKTEESKIKKGVGPTKRKWDRDSFLADIEQQSGLKARTIAERLLEWCLKNGVRICYGAGNYEASIIPVYDKGDFNNLLFAVYGRGKFYFQFQWLYPPFNEPEWKSKLMALFNQVLKNPLTINDMSRRPSFLITDLDDEAWTRLLEKFEEFIKYINENQ